MSLLLLLLLPSSSEAQCSICSDGSTPTGSFGGIPCTSFEEDLAFTAPDSDVCISLQLEAYQACNCPAYPAGQFCPLCENGFYSISKPYRPIVVWRSNDTDSHSPFLTCRDVLFGDLSVSGECDRNTAATYYCGCPNAAVPKSGCSLCDSSAQVSQASFNESPTAAPISLATSFHRRRVPPMFDATCDDYQRAATVFYQSPGECDQIGTDLPIDLPAYCGCTSTATNFCPICADGSELNTTAVTQLILNKNRTTVTCQEWAQVAEAVTDGEYCLTAITPLQGECCIGGTNNAGGGGGGESIPTGPTAAVATPPTGAPTASSQQSGGAGLVVATTRQSAVLMVIILGGMLVV
jgi:hypothetical protein